MIRRPPRSTPLYSSAASDVNKRQQFTIYDGFVVAEWLHREDGWHLQQHDTLLSEKTHVPGLRKWIGEGPPPGPSYRITKTFDHKPTYVGRHNAEGQVGPSYDIRDEDIEEVW